MSDELCIAGLDGLSTRLARFAAIPIADPSDEDLTEDRVGCTDVIADEDFLNQTLVHCKSFSSSRSSHRTTGHSSHPVITRRSSLDRTRVRRPLALIHDLAQIRLKRLVGSGGFGSVHVGLLNGRTVAVKRMHRCVKNRRAVAESVRAECRALRLRHPNVVRVLAVIAGNTGDPFAEEAVVVMEYAGQRNLQSLINDSSEELGFQRILR